MTETYKGTPLSPGAVALLRRLATAGDAGIAYAECEPESTTELGRLGLAEWAPEHHEVGEPLARAPMRLTNDGALAVIALCGAQDERRANPEPPWPTSAEAFARLLRAAPKMLQALGAAKTALDEMHTEFTRMSATKEQWGWIEQNMAEVNEAIAEATGERK